MVKIAKSFTITLENANALEAKENASEIVNQALDVYFGRQLLREITKEQRLRLLDLLKLKEDTEKQIKEITNGN